MGKKIYLSPSNQNGNLYAGGNTNEMLQCNRIASALEIKLTAAGFTVKKAPQGQAMTTTIAESNSWGADLHLCIHTNAFNGSYTGGTMCMVYSNSGDNNKAAKAMLDNLAPITPGSDYAIQTRPELRELCDTSCTALYTEVEFHDTAEGAGFIINSIDKIADCMCKAVCSFYNISYSSSATAIDTTTQMYRVRKSWTAVKTQVGAFKNLDNAKACANAYANSGYKVFGKDGNVVYIPPAKIIPTTTNLPQRFVDTAESYLGYNCDKFNAYFDADRGTSWCGEFVSYIAYCIGVIDKIIPKTDGAGVFAREGIKNGWGIWIDGTQAPQAGDIISYRWSGRSSDVYNGEDMYYSNHVAIVKSVNGNFITTIEGNSNGTDITSTVCLKKRIVGDTTINGYYRPYWDKVTGTITPPNVTTSPVPNNTSGNVKTVQQWCNKSYGTHATVDGIYGSQTKACLVGALQCIIGCAADGIFGPVTRSRCPNVAKGAAGDIVYVLQGLLICNGYKLAFDGEFGSETYNTVCAYQKANNLSVDGIAGPNTLARLCS